MIFITVGTEKFPFDRLLKAIEERVRSKEIEQEIFAQIGSSNFKTTLFACEKFIDFDGMVKFIQKSDIVVSHAGEGSTLLCLSLGKIPILFPRNVAFGEHLDNHQMELARKMDTLGKVLVAYTERELIYKIKNYKNFITQLIPSPAYDNKNELIKYLRNICSHQSRKGEQTTFEGK